MRMGLRNFFVCVVAVLFLTACGGSNSSSGVGGGAATDSRVTGALASFDTSPGIENGDRRTNVFSDFEQIDASTSCEYSISESIYVSAVNGTQATFSFTRSASLRGPANCPSQHPNLVLSETRNSSIAEFLGFERRYIERQINPELIRQRRSWVKNVSLVAITIETKRGVRCQRIDLELEHTDGRKISESIWISLDSQFLSILDHERTFVASGETESLDRVTSFTVRSGRFSN